MSSVKQCDAPGCTEPFYGRGYCKAHYHRLRRFGTIEEPFSTTYKNASLEEKLRLGAPPGRPEECWEWQRSLTSRGYPRTSHRGVRTIMVHRLAYEVHKGPVPPGISVCHKCDNPKCVNPNHLFLGTVTDNQRDKFWKGRHPHCGTHGRARMTDDEARMVRATAKCPDDYRRFARQFGVGYGTIYNLVRGNSWKRLT